MNPRSFHGLFANTARINEVIARARKAGELLTLQLNTGVTRLQVKGRWGIPTTYNATGNELFSLSSTDWPSESPEPTLWFVPLTPRHVAAYSAMKMPLSEALESMPKLAVQIERLVEVAEPELLEQARAEREALEIDATTQALEESDFQASDTWGAF